jgi:short-subunit dehydrogenase
MRSALSPTVPALVTGASSGIGEAMARALADRGHHVVAVARRRDRLEALAGAMAASAGQVEPMVADLGTDAGVSAVEERLQDGRAWVLVNNAGFGSRGRFTELDRAREVDEVRLNVVALHRLTAAVLPGCVTHGTGGVLNVASTAAFQPVPYMATYGATKAFVLHFTEALAVEVAGSGVRITALCPGATRTEFGEVAGNARQIEMAMPMGPAKVAAAGLRAFDRNQTICIPGAANAAGAFTVRLVPRAVVRRVVAPLFKPR